MATELHNLTLETVEPSVDAGVKAAGWPSFIARLSGNATGRMAVQCMNWAVVIGLVISGYFGAAAINTGVELVRHNGAAPHHMLATAAPQP